MALGPGSIAFVGFNADGNDGFAFIVIDPIAAGSIIRFSDNEWNGLAIGSGGAFNTGEGGLTWTNGGSDLAAGTIVELLNTSSISTRSANIGAISGGTIALGNSDEFDLCFRRYRRECPDHLPGCGHQHKRRLHHRYWQRLARRYRAHRRFDGSGAAPDRRRRCRRLRPDTRRNLFRIPRRRPRSVQYDRQFCRTERQR